MASYWAPGVLCSRGHSRAASSSRSFRAGWERKPIQRAPVSRSAPSTSVHWQERTAGHRRRDLSLILTEDLNSISAPLVDRIEPECVHAQRAVAASCFLMAKEVFLMPRFDHRASTRGDSENGPLTSRRCRDRPMVSLPCTPVAHPVGGRWGVYGHFRKFKDALIASRSALIRFFGFLGC
jgi:hypothetical protein